MREQRLSYGSPAGDVSRGVLVCVCFVPAGKTPELGLGLPVSLSDVSAYRAFPACVARIDGYARRYKRYRVTMPGIVNIAGVAMQNATKEFEFSGIYQLLNTENGKRYVGQAKNIANRIREHRRNRNGITANPESRLYRATKKYGWGAFQWSVLERVDDVSALDAREKFWIDALGVCNRDVGYNICSDPKTTRGWVHSEATKLKMASAKLGKFKGSSNPFFGKNHTDETKAKIGAINAARPRTDEERFKLKEARAISGAGRKARRVVQIDVETGAIIKEWGSISDACRAVGASIGSIVGCCKGGRGRKTSKGYKWGYVN